MEAKLKIGDKFRITHVDGYVAMETVAKVEFWENKYWYVCDSCACYTDEDFRNPESRFEAMNDFEAKYFTASHAVIISKGLNAVLSIVEAHPGCLVVLMENEWTGLQSASNLKEHATLIDAQRYAAAFNLASNLCKN